MRGFRNLTATLGLLVGVAACGAGSADDPTSSSEEPVQVALTACSDGLGGLSAIDSSGEIRWTRCDTSGDHTVLPVAITGSISYVVEQSISEGPALVALDIDHGDEMWRSEFPAMNEGFGFDAVYASDKASFAAGGIIVLDRLDDGDVAHVGIDATTGEERWRVVGDGLVTLNTDELVVTSTEFAGDLVGSGPAGTVTAYDRRNGELRWQAEAVPYFGGAGGAMAAGDMMIIRLYSNAGPGGVMAIDLRTGEESWRRDETLVLWSAAPEAVMTAVGDGSGQWVTNSVELVALDPTDGRELWRTSASADGTDATVAPWVSATSTDGIVIASTDQVTVGLDARSGADRWRHDTASYVAAAGTTEAAALFVGSDNGLEFVDADDGSVRWAASVPEARQFAGAAIGGELAIIAFGGPEPVAPPDGGAVPVADDPAATSVGCRGGTIVGGGWIPPFGSGVPVFDLTVLTSADGSSFCIVNGAGVEDVVPYPSEREVAELDGAIVQGVLADYLVVTVPADWGQNPSVTLADGQQLSSTASRDGRVVLVIDNAPVGATPEQYVDRTFVFTGSAGNVLAELTVSAPPTPAISDVLACLAKYGAHVAPAGMPETGPLDRQPLEPAIASAAWSACRWLVLLNLESSGQNLPDGTLESMDCMASKGFIQMFSGGDIDAAAHAVAWSECSVSLPLGSSGLRCSIHPIGADGTVSPDPAATDIRGFGMGAEVTAPSTAPTGSRITVVIPTATTGLIGSGLGYEILEHRDFARTFTVVGATIVPGSLVQEESADGGAAMATADTVVLERRTPVAGGGDAVFPGATFELVADSPGAVTVMFTGYDSTMTLRGSDGVETTVRTLCVTDDRVVATIAVS